jgi:hypothetical protein
MSWKASVVRGAAIAWAIILIGAFVVFAGVTILMPSTKSGRIHFDRETEPAAAAAAAAAAPIEAAEAPATQPVK